MKALRRRQNFARAAALAPAFAVVLATASAAPITLNLSLPPDFDYRPVEPRANPVTLTHRARGAIFALAVQDDGARLMTPDDALFRFAGEDGETQTIAIRAKDVQLDPGALDVTAALARQSLADDATVDRLVAPGPFEAESTTTAYAGAKGTWFKQISFAAAGAVSEKRATQNPAFRDVVSGDALRETQAGALWLSTQADFGDAKTLKWTVVAQFGVVEDGFRAAGSARLRPEGTVPIPGERAYAMTHVKSGDVAMSASVQSLSRDDGETASRRVTLEHAWGSASFLAREAVRGARETVSTGYALELLPSEVAPETAAFLPSLLSFEMRDESKTGGVLPPEELRTLALDAAWSTAMGETFLSWWQSAPSTGNVADALLDATQSLSFGDWRLSLGVSHMTFRDAEVHDATLAAHGRIAYAPKDWLHVEFGLDRSANETLAEFEDPFAFERLDLLFALDAAPWLRAVFDINAVARLEARHTIDRFTPSASAAADRTAIAATFAAPL